MTLLEKVIGKPTGSAPRRRPQNPWGSPETPAVRPGGLVESAIAELRAKELDERAQAEAKYAKAIFAIAAGGTVSDQADLLPAMETLYKQAGDADRDVRIAQRFDDLTQAFEGHAARLELAKLECSAAQEALGDARERARAILAPAQAAADKAQAAQTREQAIADDRRLHWHQNRPLLHYHPSSRDLVN